MTGKNRRPALFRPPWQPKPDQALAARRAALAKAAPPRPSNEARGYGKDWRAVRAAVLDAEPYCRECAAQGIQREAKVVDHILSIATRPDLRLERSNLRPMCHPCHNAKTNRIDRGFGMKPRRPKA
jgi:5-methylcytosine-specific restriction protein A